MATVPLSMPGITRIRFVPTYAGYEFPATTTFSSPVGVRLLRFNRRSCPNLAVRAATTVDPKYTSVKPLGDRVFVKIKLSEEKTTGGILIPLSSQSKPQAGEIVSIGDGRTVGQNNVEIGFKVGAHVVYSKYAGTELKFNGSSHLLLKEDDIVGILDTDDIKDLEPVNDRILIKVTEAEEKTAGGLLLPPTSKEKPSTGTVVAVGPGSFCEKGKRKPPSVTPGNTVMYSKFAGSEFKSSDGSAYIVVRESDIVAMLSS